MRAGADRLLELDAHGLHILISDEGTAGVGAAMSEVELMGADRVIFGSDWPHIEALPHPLDYVPETKPLSDGDRKKVLLDNALELAQLRPR